MKPEQDEGVWEVHRGKDYSVLRAPDGTRSFYLNPFRVEGDGLPEMSEEEHGRRVEARIARNPCRVEEVTK